MPGGPWRENLSWIAFIRNSLSEGFTDTLSMVTVPVCHDTNPVAVHKRFGNLDMKGFSVGFEVSALFPASACGLVWIMRGQTRKLSCVKLREQIRLLYQDFGGV
jgi:hypothetical protein